MEVNKQVVIHVFNYFGAILCVYILILDQEELFPYDLSHLKYIFFKEEKITNKCEL